MTTPDAKNAWFAAVRNGNVKEIQDYINLDKSYINLMNEHGKTALIVASCKRHLNIVELLLQNGADVNAQNKYGEGETALIVACYNRSVEIVELLLRKGADVDVQDNHRSTALLVASANGYQKIVELLLQKDASIDLKDKNGKTALDCAIFMQRTTIQRLIEDHQKKQKNTYTSDGSAPGNPSTPIFSGTGAVTFPSGAVFTGTFKNNEPESGSVAVPTGTTFHVVGGKIDLTF